MAIASPPAQPNLSTKFRAYLTETGVTGDRADALARKFDLYLAEREKQASAIPEDGSGFFGEALKGATRSTLNIAAGAASSGPSVIQYLGEAVAGANALPMQVLGGAANMLGMPTLGDAYQRTAEAVASKGIDISRAVGRVVANTPIMPAGGLTLPMMAQAPRALAQSKMLAPSDRAAADLAQMNNGTNFLPQTSAGWGSLTGEQLPALGLGFGAGLVGGPSVGVGVTSLAAGAQEYESTLAQLMQEFPGKSMDFYEGEAARRAIQSAAVESVTERLPMGEILEGKLAKMFIGKAMNQWPRWARVLMGQTAKAVTSAASEGAEEVVSEGAGAVGDRLAGDPNAFQNLPKRMATAGLIGGAMGAGMGGITPGGFGTVPPQTPPTDRMGGRGPTQSRTPEITPRTPETTTATPDTSALDEAAALAEQRLNERAAPVGTPSPADQVASSQPEQDGAGVDPNPGATSPVEGQTGEQNPDMASGLDPVTASPGESQTGLGGTRPGSREEVQYRIDQKMASGMERQAAFAAVQQELTAEAENRLNTDGEILVDEYGDEWQVEHFGIERNGPKDRRGVKKLTNSEGVKYAPNEQPTILGDDAVTFARSLRRRNPGTSGGLSDSDAQGTETNPYAEAEQNLLRQREARREARAVSDNRPKTTSADSSESDNTRTSQAPALSSLASRAPSPPVAPSSGQASSASLGTSTFPPPSAGGQQENQGQRTGGGSVPSPQSTREPWQMTRAEWVGGGTVGRIKFGDVDQEFVESPQFDTPEEAKAWAASRGIANAQIQSSGKRGGPKLYKASGSTSFHRDAVEAAHAAGKPVPPEVLAEYGIKPNPSESPNSSTQPQGQAAATTNKEPANGEDEAPQAQVLNTGTAAPAQGTGAVSAEPFTRTDGTAKEAGTKRVEELRATFKTKRAGWHFAETDEGATLIHPTEDRVVRFKANQSNQRDRARTYAQAFADDNPVKTEQTTPGELKVQELKIGGEAPDTTPLPHHVAVYGGKAVSMDYATGDQFKLAGMRIADNGAEGFIVTPDLKVFAVTKGKKAAQRVRDEAVANKAIADARKVFSAIPTSPDKPISVDAAAAMSDFQIRKRVMDLIELVGGKPANQMNISVNIEIEKAKALKDNGPELRPSEYEMPIRVAKVVLNEHDGNTPLAKKIGEVLVDSGMQMTSGFGWHGADGRSSGRFHFVSDADYDALAQSTIATTEPTYAPPQPAPAKVEGKKPRANEFEGQVYQATKAKRDAWKRLKLVRDQVKAKTKTRLDLLKAESAHREAVQWERQAIEQFNAREAELGRGTTAPAVSDKPKPGDSAKAERQAEIDAIAPDSELDATGTTTTIADIVNNIREGKRRYVTARDSQNKRLGASMLESVRKSVVSGMERLREERAKWETRGRATIPQEQTDGTGGSSAGSVGTARVNGQGAGSGQQAQDARVSGTVPPAKRGNDPRFTRADIERRILKLLEDVGLSNTERINDLASEENAKQSNEQFSTSFSDTTMKGEIERLIEGRPFYRKFFRWNVKNGTGEESLQRLGEERYMALLEETFSPIKTALSRAQQLRGKGPDSDMLLWLSDRLNNKVLEGKKQPKKKRKMNLPTFDVMQAADLKDGQTFTIDGVPFEVMRDENDDLAAVQRGPNGEPIDDGQKWVLAGLEDIPTDAGTLGMRDDTGEVPDIAPAPEAEQEPQSDNDADAMLGRIKEQLGRGNGRQSPEMIRAFQELGNALVPGVRLQDAEEVGRMYAMLDDGSVTLAEYTTYIEDLRKSGKVAKAEPEKPAPAKFSDSEGVFGQKTESITGAQRGMFGDISPEPTAEMQDRYPGIRRGETVAEYEKRMGTADTPDMFGGVEDKGDISKAKRGKPKHAIQFRTPIVGPSGAKILSYEWAWTWESVDTEDDTVERRVSDWSEAELNDDTNRLIVHQFSVQQPSGDVRLVSLESALQMLGYMEKSSGKPIRSLASTLKTLAFNRMKLEQLRKVFDVYDAAKKKADELVFNPKEVTTRVEDAALPHLAKEGTKRIVWEYRGEEIHWEYWYPNSGRPVESSIRNPSHDIESMGRAWKRSKIKDFIPQNAEGITNQDRAQADWKHGQIAVQIRDLEQRNEKLQRKIDAFDGGDGSSGTGGSSPGTPFRNTPTINDRAAAALMDWSGRARKRFDDFMGAWKRGEVRMSGPPITPLIDLAAHVAFKALASGITSKSGRKLTAFIEGRMADIRSKWPDLNVTTATLRRQVRNMLAAANDDREKIIPAYAAARERVERQRTTATGKESGKPAEVREAVASATAERPDVAAKIIQAAKAAYRQGRAEGRREAETAIPGLLGQIKRQRKQLLALAEIERRGGKAEAEADQAVRDGIRKQMIQYAQTLPPRVRGKLVASIATATTPIKMIQTVRRLERELYRAIGRDSRSWFSKTLKPKKLLKSKGMTDNARNRLTAIRQESANALGVLRSGDANLTAMRAAVATLAKLQDEAGVILQTERAAYRQIEGDRKFTAINIAQQATDDVKAAAKTKTTDDQADYEANPAVRLSRSVMDIRNAVQMVTGKIGSQLESVLYKRFVKAENAMFEQQRELRAQVERACKAAGFKDAADASRVLSGRGGKGNTERVRATFGGKSVVITLGEALGLLGHASDPMTLSLIHSEGGQPFQTIRGRLRSPVTPDPNDIDALANQIDPDGKYRKFLEDIKAIMESTTDASWRVHYLLKGFEPVRVEKRWPRPRNMQANAETSVLPETASEMLNTFLENDGHFTHRVQTTGVPILLIDPITVVLDEISTATRTIHLAVPLRDAANVIYQPGLSRAIAARFGKSMFDSLRTHLMRMGRSSRVLGNPTARWVARINNWRAVSSLGLNPGTWAVTAISALRLLPMMGAQDFAAGIAGAKDVSMEDMMRKSGHAWERYEGSQASDRYSSVVGVDTESPTHGTDEMKAMLANIKAKDPVAAFANLQRIARMTMRVLNWFDGLVYRIAWAGLTARAKRLHPEWSTAQTERWVAAKASAMIRESQQGSSPVDAAMGPERVKGTALSGITLFSSDALKSRNRIRRAFRKGKAAGTAALAAEVTSVVLGVVAKRAIWGMFSLAIAAMLGWDDEDEERLTSKYIAADRAGADAAAELANLVVPIIGQNVVRAMQNPWGSMFIDSPSVGAVEQALMQGNAAVRKAMDDEATAEEIAVAWARFVNQSAGAAGVNPLEPWMQRILTEVKAAGE